MLCKEHVCKVFAIINAEDIQLYKTINQHPAVLKKSSYKRFKTVMEVVHVRCNVQISLTCQCSEVSGMWLGKSCFGDMQFWKVMF